MNLKERWLRSGIRGGVVGRERVDEGLLVPEVFGVVEGESWRGRE